MAQYSKGIIALIVCFSSMLLGLCFVGFAKYYSVLFSGNFISLFYLIFFFFAYGILLEMSFIMGKGQQK